MAIAMSTEKQVHLPSFLPNGSVPLKFLAAGLEEWLKRIHARPSQSEITRGTSWLAQESFKAHADCTFLQFDSIANDVHHKLASKDTFDPCLETAKEYIVQEVKVNFKKFAHMVQVFGTVSRDTIKDMMVRTRFDRCTNTPVSARAIACMTPCTLEDQSSPCYITVGDSLKTVCDDGDDQRHVIYRTNCEWDPVEDTYQTHCSPYNIPKPSFSDE